MQGSGGNLFHAQSIVSCHHEENVSCAHGVPLDLQRTSLHLHGAPLDLHVEHFPSWWHEKRILAPERELIRILGRAADQLLRPRTRRGLRQSRPCRSCRMSRVMRDALITDYKLKITNCRRQSSCTCCQKQSIFYWSKSST